MPPDDVPRGRAERVPALRLQLVDDATMVAGIESLEDPQDWLGPFVCPLRSVQGDVRVVEVPSSRVGVSVRNVSLRHDALLSVRR